jgi:hypothetical protein
LKLDADPIETREEKFATHRQTPAFFLFPGQSHPLETDYRHTFG